VNALLMYRNCEWYSSCSRVWRSTKTARLITSVFAGGRGISSHQRHCPSTPLSLLSLLLR